jgi:Pvc16 N-terminal domain
MKVLMRYPKLPEAVLQGSLAQQEPPMRTTILRPSLLQSFGEFWQAIGGTPKAALNYCVTIAVSVDRTIESIPLVVDKRF